MLVTTRSLRRAGIGAGLALALALPTAAAANAAPATGHATTTTVTPAGVSLSAHHTALITLRKAIAKADRDYRHAVATAQAAFNHDPVVVLAKSTRRGIIGTSTDAGVILAANIAYADSVSGAADTRAAAIDAARTTRFAAVDAAYAAYDLVVNPPNAIARNAFRAAMRSANYELRTHVAAAYKTFRVTTAPAHATQRAAINSAVATYEASAKTSADLTAFTHALKVARHTFNTDPVVTGARTTRHTALHSAWVTYSTSVHAARVAFHTATGHWPHYSKIVLPKV